MMLCVSPSHSVSICLIWSAVSQAGGSEASIRSSRVAPETIRSARVMKSAKELFFSGNQAEAHAGEYVTRTLHCRYITVTP